MGSSSTFPITSYRTLGRLTIFLTILLYCLSLATVRLLGTVSQRNVIVFDATTPAISVDMFRTTISVVHCIVRIRTGTSGEAATNVTIIFGLAFSIPTAIVGLAFGVTRPPDTLLCVVPLTRATVTVETSVFGSRPDGGTTACTVITHRVPSAIDGTTLRLIMMIYSVAISRSFVCASTMPMRFFCSWIATLNLAIRVRITATTPTPINTGVATPTSYRLHDISTRWNASRISVPYHLISVTVTPPVTVFSGIRILTNDPRIHCGSCIQR